MIVLQKRVCGLVDLDVGGHALRFTAQGAADDIATGEVVFNVYCDGRLAATSGPLVAGRKPHPFDVDLRGVRTGRPILFKVPVTGEAPLKVEVCRQDEASCPRRAGGLCG